MARLPLGGLDDIIGHGPCLILAPHADDESLGCGGLIAACCAAGRPPLVAFLTDGTGSHPNSRAYPPERLRDVRMRRRLGRRSACLGLSPDRAVFLEQRDTAAPHSGPAFDAVVGKAARRWLATRPRSWRPGGMIRTVITRPRR